MALPRDASRQSSNIQDLDSRNDGQTNTHISTTTSTKEHPSNYNPPSSRVVRRRRPDPKPSQASIMSLVGIKNLFFRQTVTKVPVRKYNNSNSAPRSPLEWNGSAQPLLEGTTPTTPGDSHREVSIDDDVESQDSKMEKASRKKAFKVDARVISDATIGLSDGLTVPFALTAGLSALGSTRFVIYGGFAELIAGAISMGLGGYLGAKSEAASYQAQKEEALQLIAAEPQTIIADITDVFEPYHLPKHTLDDLTRHLVESPRLLDFVMKFCHCLEEPDSARPVISGLTIGSGYFFGGLFPLLPYFWMEHVRDALEISIAIMVIVLFIFGYAKTGATTGWTGGRNIREACWEGATMVVVGGLAAAAAMGLVKLFDERGV